LLQLASHQWSPPQDAVTLGSRTHYPGGTGCI
jgi:hypothetical protein